VQSKVEKLPESKVKLTITVEKEDLSSFESHAYKNLVTKVKVAGFRPGKAPIAVLKKEVGDARFNEEVLETAIPQSYYKVVVEKDVQAISQPQVRVTKFVPGELLEFEAEVAILPEVKLPNYKEIKIKEKKETVSSEEFEEVLLNLRKEKSVLREVEREAKEGDRVEIDFDGFVGGSPIAGGSSKNHPLVIGEKMFIPGFEEELIGLKTGDTKEFDIKFPDSYHAKELAGKGAHFIVKVKLVQEVELPQINDDFAKQVGPFETAEKLKEAIKENMEAAKKDESKSKAEQELLDKIIEKAVINIPKELIDQEVSGLISDMEHNFTSRGVEFEKYLESVKKTREDLKKEYNSEGERRVKIGLVLSQIAKEEGILVTDAEIEAEIDKRMVGLDNAQDLRQNYLANPELRKNIEIQVFTRKTIDKLMSYALK
jgi:trigger factor